MSGTVFQARGKERDGSGAAPSSGSQILRAQTGVLRDPGEHARTDFFAIVKGKDAVRPPRPTQYAMGTAALTPDHPADA